MSHVSSYSPAIAPAMADGDARELARYVEHELQEIAKALQQFTTLRLLVLHEAPERPREGLLAAADGSDWDPGSGGGIYAYFGGSWVKLS